MRRKKIGTAAKPPQKRRPHTWPPNWHRRNEINLGLRGFLRALAALGSLPPPPPNRIAQFYDELDWLITVGNAIGDSYVSSYLTGSGLRVLRPRGPGRPHAPAPKPHRDWARPLGPDDPHRIPPPSGGKIK